MIQLHGQQNFKMLITYQDIQTAQLIIGDAIHVTPCVTSQQFQTKYCPGRKLYFKCENLQKCGSFKVRGAVNAVRQLKQRDPSISGSCCY